MGVRIVSILTQACRGELDDVHGCVRCGWLQQATMGGVSSAAIRPAFSSWPRYNRQLRDVVAALTDEQLAIRPSPERWPVWATVGHLACQRVSWLCGFAGEPGADATPFPDALHRCPGDEY